MARPRRLQRHRQDSRAMASNERIRSSFWFLMKVLAALFAVVVAVILVFGWFGSYVATHLT
jgi:hypothetical protein